MILSCRSRFRVAIIGESEEKRPIYNIELGSGPIMILIWTQMQGNEATGTRTVFNLLMLFEASSKDSSHLTETILKKCSIKIIPMLNPDGAHANARQIDLYRDAVDLIAKNVILDGKHIDLGILFKESINDDTLVFTPEIEKEGELSGFIPIKLSTDLSF